jgi:2-alkyl-3-oxoalkanoate reductase
VKLFITGASGFLGTATVQRAVANGHHVVALVRPAAVLRDPVWSSPSVEVRRGDLRQRGEWAAHLDDLDVIVHLAAAASGDLATQFHGTVIATENLLAWLDVSHVKRIVHVSSFSVYDFAAIPRGAVLDESSPIESDPRRRDAYTTTKLLQEEMVRDAAATMGVELVVLRPGAIFGPGKDWAFGSAMAMGRRAALVFSPSATFRLTYVDNCADAIVAACVSTRAAGTTLNIVDDQLPTHLQFFGMCRSAGSPVEHAVPVPWPLVQLVGRLVALMDSRLLGGRAKLPEFVAYVRQQARWKPLRYSNRRAKEVLDWSPTVTIAEGVRRTMTSS